MHCNTGRKVKCRRRQEEATAMLTFSGEQRSVEAALAVFSHPPSLLSTSLIPSLFLSCFLPCRMTGMKCWLLIKTTRPASVPAILLTCSLALQFSSSYFLIISLHSVSSVIPIVLCLRPPAVPAPSLTPVHRTSPPSSFLSFLPSLHPSSSLPYSFCLSHLSATPSTSTPRMSRG